MPTSGGHSSIESPKRCCWAAVFKKDTKEKNQKKAEAKKRKAEQQEQQEPVDDSLVGTNVQNEPGAAANLDLQPGQLPVQQPAEPGLQDIQAEPGMQAQPQLPRPALERDASNQEGIGRLKDSGTEPETDGLAATIDTGFQHQPALS